MKYNLYELSVILHYRKDSEDRENNLISVLKFLYDNFVVKEIIVVNDDKHLDSDLELISKEYPFKRMHLPNEDHFRKSSSFNGAAESAKGLILAFWDVDVLIDPRYVDEAYNKILTNKADHVYPFNGTFIDVQKDIFIENENFDLNDYYIKWKAGHESFHFASGESPGGCNLISKTEFWKIGGYDERFVGWDLKIRISYKDQKRKIEFNTWIMMMLYVGI